jgi:hypothetical protein
MAAHQRFSPMPICGDDDRFMGMATDRDIVVEALAHGKDPATTTARRIAQERLVFVRAADPIDRAFTRMQEHKVKRLPVIDENKRLCGMVTEATCPGNGPAKWSARSPPPSRSTPASWARTESRSMSRPTLPPSIPAISGSP